MHYMLLVSANMERKSILRMILIDELLATFGVYLIKPSSAMKVENICYLEKYLTLFLFFFLGTSIIATIPVSMSATNIENRVAAL